MRRSDSGTAKAIGIALGLAGCGLLLPQGSAAFGKTSALLAGRFDIALGIEAMSGETDYSIGGNYTLADGQTGSTVFPMSTLEWPLDIWLMRVDAGWSFSPAWRINGTVKKNLTEPGENMIDKDWSLVSPGQVDVYSESTISSFDALIVDVDLEWTFWQKGLWTFYTGAGYQHQNFQYDGAPISQYSPSGQPGYDYTWNGKEKGITYEMTYSMPYVLIGSEYQLTPELRLTGRFAFAPLVGAEDKDVHLFRNKVSTGDMDGTAYMMELSGIYYLTPWWFVEAGAHYTSISVDGTQDQVEGGEALGRIDMEAKSTQTAGYLNIGYSF